MFTVNNNPSRRELKKFAVAVLIGFGVIGAITWCAAWYQSGDTGALAWSGRTPQWVAIAAWSLGLGMALAGLGPNFVGRPVYIVWMTFGVTMGMVMSTIALTLMFFVLLPVFSLVVRVGDPIRKKLSDGETYWEDYRPHEATLERMQRQF